ncbi:MAG: alpha/beta hydrolase-fold protein [Planctomycetaceae bacterium]
MSRLPALLSMLLLTAPTLLLGADVPVTASSEQKAELKSKLDELRKAVAALPPDKGRPLERKDDAAVCAKAVEWLLRHDEFYKPSYVRDAVFVLQTGLNRADELAHQTARYGTKPGKTIRAYRSKVDGSLQPYALSLPEEYNPKAAKRYPLYVVLHGRGATLSEVSFIKQHEGKPVAEGQTWIQLDVFGRVNNAYRWAGETDVFEALADVERRYKVDDRRITLWGFSMGGAGAWHLGLQHPSRWSSVGAGAGFVDFYKYLKQESKLPEWQDRTLRIYDAVDYAMNLHDIPFITYGGENDPQLASSQRMEAEAKPFEAPLTTLVGPGMGHKFDDDSLKQFMAFHAEHSAKGRPKFPGPTSIRFSTCTLKYNRCEWLTIWEMSEPYERATVSSRLADDGVLEIETENITGFSVARSIADRVRIDGSANIPLLDAADNRLPDVYFVGSPLGWDMLDYDDSLNFIDNPQREKRHDLQGPIDDAFMLPFVCVRGTGDAWNDNHQVWCDWNLQRAEREWDKWMRGRLPVDNDVEITDQQIKSKNLILFGDPGSNQLLAKVLDDLPIEWTQEGLTVKGQKYDPAEHGVSLVFPNPLNPDRYVVLNSGLTMHDADFKASNAWLFPKLGDIAVQKFSLNDDGYDESTVWAEIFDSEWKLP